MSARLHTRHARPSCGHQWIRECPLTVSDWDHVFTAYLAFLLQCRIIAEQAHERADHKASRLTEGEGKT